MRKTQKKYPLCIKEKIDSPKGYIDSSTRSGATNYSKKNVKIWNTSKQLTLF